MPCSSQDNNFSFRPRTCSCVKVQPAKPSRCARSLKNGNAEAARCCDYPYRFDRLKPERCRWCVVALRPSSLHASKVEDHRFQGIMWGGGTTSFIQADLENTIDTLKWPSYKGSAGGTAQQMTCFDRVGGGVQGRRSLIVGATLLSSCTLCAHE